jgi:hypothetical protein
MSVIAESSLIASSDWTELAQQRSTRELSHYLSRPNKYLVSMLDRVAFFCLLLMGGILVRGCGCERREGCRHLNRYIQTNGIKYSIYFISFLSASTFTISSPYITESFLHPKRSLIRHQRNNIYSSHNNINTSYTSIGSQSALPLHFIFKE